jgi:hypothetical protein
MLLHWKGNALATPFGWHIKAESEEWARWGNAQAVTLSTPSAAKLNTCPAVDSVELRRIIMIIIKTIVLVDY